MRPPEIWYPLRGLSEALSLNYVWLSQDLQYPFYFFCISCFIDEVYPPLMPVDILAACAPSCLAARRGLTFQGLFVVTAPPVELMPCYVFISINMKTINHLHPPKFDPE